MHMLLILLALCLRKSDGISHLFSIAYAFAGNGWVVCPGQLTREEIICGLKHYWRFGDSEALELKALSQEVHEKAA